MALIEGMSWLTLNEVSYIFNRQYQVVGKERNPVGRAVFNPASEQVTFYHVNSKTGEDVDVSYASSERVHGYLKSMRTQKAQIADKIFDAAEKLGVKIKRVPSKDFSAIPMYPGDVGMASKRSSVRGYRNLTSPELADMDILPEDMIKFLTVLNPGNCPEGAYMLFPVISKQDMDRVDKKSKRMAPSSKFAFNETTEKQLMDALIVHTGKDLIDEELKKEILLPSYKIVPAI
ncbi:MAG: hypothetical protein J4452_00630 [Candidatus Aenigmarchaeota archaeon]|nr:hypothetical protein [Candidatus Aenigmarchaeota archaeon]